MEVAVLGWAPRRSMSILVLGDEQEEMGHAVMFGVELLIIVIAQTFLMTVCYFVQG